MPITEARKRGNRKWDAAHMVTVTTRIRKEKAELFRAAAAKEGKTPGQILKETIDKYIENSIKE